MKAVFAVSLFFSTIAFAQISESKKGELIRDLPIAFSTAAMGSGIAFTPWKINPSAPFLDRKLCYQISALEHYIDTAYYIYVPLEHNGISTGIQSADLKQVFQNLANLKGFCAVAATAGLAFESAKADRQLTTAQEVFETASTIEKQLNLISSRINIRLK